METNDAYRRHIEHVLQSIRGYALEHKLTPDELKAMFRHCIVARHRGELDTEPPSVVAPAVGA